MKKNNCSSLVLFLVMIVFTMCSVFSSTVVAEETAAEEVKEAKTDTEETSETFSTIASIDLLKAVKKSASARSVSKLLDQGADPNATDIYGRTPLIKLLKGRSRDKLNITRLLISVGANVKVRDEMGDTALILASIHDYSEIILELKDAGAMLDEDELAKVAEEKEKIAQRAIKEEKMREAMELERAAQEQARKIREELNKQVETIAKERDDASKKEIEKSNEVSGEETKEVGSEETKEVSGEETKEVSGEEKKGE